MTLGDCAAAGQADIAEFYDTDGTPEPGDVVIPKAGIEYGVTRSSSVGQANAIGIVSTNPAADSIMGNNVKTNSRQPIALSGRIPLKVSLENGPVVAGDLLMTGSQPGTAAKAIGSSPRVSDLVAREEQDRAVTHAKDLPDYTSDPSRWSDDTGKIMVFLKLSGGSAPLNQSDLQTAVFDGGVVARDTTFNGVVAFNKGVHFADTATFDGNIAVNQDTAGTMTIPQGDQSAIVSFSKPHLGQPIVTISPKQFITGSYRVTKVDSQRFTIELTQPQSQDVDFNWTALDSTASVSY
jgi:hypothetical protein